ncbi:hypothetical protein T01_9133 [Trichinella spiralis]|uniref:MAM domain-containing protein n=1 Tax=Trichinella spiralis TaxID=6334 RepID=A0A0V1B848_TRISP|nr:hypothetical protein T01_9133 [Trichinella spiralis]
MDDWTLVNVEAGRDLLGQRRQRVPLLAIDAGVAWVASFACHGRRRGCGGCEEETIVTQYSPMAELFGPNVRAMPYDSSTFDSANGGPVTGPEQMSCDFETSCCWQNNKPPLDKLEWSTLEGTPDPEVFNRAFGTPNIPSGRFLAIASGATDSSDEAQFHSCSIACTEEPVRVSLRHWTTDGVKLQVCTREAFFDNPENAPLLNCQELPRTSSPGPTTVELSPGEFFDVVIVAYNFVSNLGAAAVDDVRVDFVPCTPTEEPGVVETPAEPVPAPAGGECEAFVCGFEGRMCAYQDLANSGLATTSWEIVQGRFRNPLTGLNNAPSGSYYVATYLLPNQRSVLRSTGNLADERVIKFQYYKATQGIQLVVCCGPNSDICGFKTPIDVEVGDRVWKVGYVVCPAGPNQITFTAINNGANQGAVGLDDVGVYRMTGAPQDATETVC